MEGLANLANVKTVPGHRKTTLATARPFLRYFSGLPPYATSSSCALVAFVPETYALWLATMYVYASAQESVKRHAKMEQIFQANLTALDSFRSGQNRSKKKAVPKMVATKIPTKMLYEAMPT
jgi:hypothetical protein